MKKNKFKKSHISITAGLVFFLMAVCTLTQAQTFTIQKGSKLSYSNKEGREEVKVIDVLISNIKPELEFTYNTNSYGNKTGKIKIAKSLIDSAYRFAIRIEDVTQGKEGDVFNSSNILVSKKVYAAIIANNKYEEPINTYREEGDTVNIKDETAKMIFAAKPSTYKCSINGNLTTVQAIALQFEKVIAGNKLQQVFFILKNENAPILLQAYSKLGNDTIYNFKLVKVIL